MATKIVKETTFRRDLINSRQNTISTRQRHNLMHCKTMSRVTVGYVPKQHCPGFQYVDREARSMPAFLYFLLISELCHCDSLISIEAFDTYDPPNDVDFDLSTSNSTKLTHTQDNVYMLTETAKYSSSSTKAALNTSITNNVFNTSGDANTTIPSNDTDSILSNGFNTTNTSGGAYTTLGPYDADSTLSNGFITTYTSGGEHSTIVSNDTESILSNGFNTTNTSGTSRTIVSYDDTYSISNGFNTTNPSGGEYSTIVSNDTDINRQLYDTSAIRMQFYNYKPFELPNDHDALNAKIPMNSTTNANETVNNQIKKKNGTVTFLNTCPEEEPTKIGAYEVPTQRDMLLHIRSHLLAMYSGFHAKAMHFLKDIKEATQASWSRKMFCQSPAELMHYRRCVRWVRDLAIITTKSLVTALESMRLEVTSLVQGKICNISSLNIDPIHLIRILAAERVSLEFALPDFLRQLHACANLCPSTLGVHAEQDLKTARLTNQDFILRHYYTQQNYNKQLNKQYKI